MRKIYRKIALLLIITLVVQNFVQPNLFPYLMQKASAEDTNIQPPAEVDTQAPSAPTGITVEEVTYDRISLSWDASTDNIGVIGYVVYCNGETFETKGTDFTYTILNHGETYSFMVKAKDAAGNFSSASEFADITTDADKELTDKEAPAVPQNLAVVSVTDTTATIEWLPSTDNTGVTAYEIFIDSILVGISDITSYTAANLKPDTIYHFTVKAKDIAGNLSEESEILELETNKQSQTVTDDLSEQLPLSLTAEVISDSSILLSWNTIAGVGESRYELYCNDVKITETSDTEYTYAGFKGASYSFYLIGYDKEGKVLGHSNLVDIVTDNDNTVLLSAPVNLQAVIVSRSVISLSWQNPVGNTAAAGFVIYRNGSESGRTTDTNYLDEEVLPGVIYNYTVMAYDSLYNLSDASETLSAGLGDIQAPTVPAALKAVIVNGSSIILTWEPSADNIAVVGYDIYSGSDLIGTTDGETSFTVTDTEEGAEYTFTVHARDDAGNISGASNAVSVRIPSYLPSLLSAVEGENGITILWSAATGADSYELSINGDIINTGNSTVYIQTEVQPNSYYEYKVRAARGAEKGEWSNTVTLLTAPSKVMNLRARAIDITTVYLTWDSVDGASAYEIECNKTVIDTVTDSGYTDSNASSVTDNTYRVRAINGELKGAWSDILSMETQTVIPGGILSEDTNWDITGGIYIVEGDLTIAEGATLNIMPGTIINFCSAAGMNVQGKLAAQGTEEANIIFTAYEDQHNTEEEEIGAESGWKGISIESTGEFTGDFVRISYGGYYNELDSYNGSTLQVQGELHLTNSEISGSYQEGILIRSGNHVSIENSRITASAYNNIAVYKEDAAGTVIIKNNGIDAASKYGICIYEAVGNGLTIENNLIQDNEIDGIRLDGYDMEECSIRENAVSNNAAFPISINLEGIKSSTIFEGITENTFSGNGSNDRILLSGTAQENITISNCNQFIINNIGVKTGATVTIQPGTVLLGGQGEGIIRIDGKLTALGTEEQPVVFTSVNDPEYGGSGLSGANDAWAGIYVERTGEFLGDYVKVNYAGYYSEQEYQNSSALYIQGGLKLNHSYISGSFQDGIGVNSGADITINNTTVEDSQYSNIAVLKYTYDTGRVTIENSILRNASERGIYVNESGAGELVIRNNTIEGNGEGIGISAHGTGLFSLTGNDIRNSLSYPVILYLDGIESSSVFKGIYDNTFSGNTSADYICLTGSPYHDLTISNNNRYVIENICIPEESTLTIQPGTVLFGYHTKGYLDVSGKLLAEGTADNPIVFTSLFDQKYGGSGVNGFEDNWRGIHVGGTGDFKGDYVTVSYAGYYEDYDEQNNYSAIYVQGRFYLNSSRVIDSVQNGIVIDSDKDVILQNSTLENSGRDNIRIGGVNVGEPIISFLPVGNLQSGSEVPDESEAGSIIVRNNDIRFSHASGIRIVETDESSVIIENNTIENNNGYPVEVELYEMKTQDLFSGIVHNIYRDNNAADYIYLGGTLRTDLTLPKDTYVAGVNISSDSMLTIQGGVTILGAHHGGFSSSGKLLIIGTNEEPVIMTSIYDPSFGGSGVTEDNAWSGITVYGELEAYNLKIRYGNNSNISAYGSITIVNSEITDAKYGIALYDTPFSPFIKYNKFKNNEWAVSYQYRKDMIIDLTYNYWNSVFGPVVGVAYSQGPLTPWIIPEIDSPGEKILFYDSQVGHFVVGFYIPYLGSETAMALHFSQVKGTYAPTGNYSNQFTDMSVKCLDDEISFTRTYNSQDGDEDGIFGKGWTLSYESGITDSKDFERTKIVRLPDGSQENYTVNADGTFTANFSRNTLKKEPNGSYILTKKDRSRYGFNADGRLIRIESKEGNRLTISLNAEGKPGILTDYVGRDYNFTYENGLLKSIEDPAGRTVNYYYDNKRLIKSMDPAGVTTYYDYNPDGYLSEIRDGNNKTLVSVTYKVTDGTVQVDQETDAYGNMKIYAYDNTNGKTIITDSNGRITTQWYDSTYNITHSTDPDGRETKAGYYTEDGINRYGELSFVTDRNGSTTQYERDDNGNIIREIYQDGSYKKYTYDDKNNLTGECDEEGKYTYYIYDSTGTLLIKTVKPFNGTESYSGNEDDEPYAITRYTYYDNGEGGIPVKGLIKTVTDPNGYTITYTYDSYGNIKTATDEESNTTTYTHNAVGWLMSTLSPKNELTRYTYNKNGNLETQVLEGGETTRIYYDTLGRKKQELSPNVYRITPDGEAGYRYTYYPSGKLYTVTDPEDNVTSYTYDRYGNTLTETKPNGSIYSYEYDNMNRAVSEFMQDSDTSDRKLLKSYDYAILNGGVTRTTQVVYLNESETATTVMEYDYAGRLVKQTNPDSGTLKTVYNKNGTIYSVLDALDKTTYHKYDGLNRLVEQWIPFDYGYLYTYKVYSYDGNGNAIFEGTGIAPVSLWDTTYDLIETSYVYGVNDWLYSVYGPGNAVTEYRYDKNGNISAEIVYLDEETTKETEYEYNYLGKVETVTQHAEAGDIYGNGFDDRENITLITSYRYDANGNVISKKTPDQKITAYSYDKLDRQASRTMEDTDEYGNPADITTTATYDFAGNIVTSTDANGNVTKNNYNSRGLLESSVDPEEGKTAYYYDNAGRLVAKVLPESFAEGALLAEMSRSQFVYDRMDRVILEQDIYYNEADNAFKTINAKAYRYDLNGNVIKSLDALGYESGIGATIKDRIESGYGTYNIYNDAGMLVDTISPDSMDRGLLFDVVYDYDAAGRLVYEIDANNVKKNYYYDDAGRLTKATVMDSTEKILKESTYDYMGNILTETDGNGNVTTYSYNRLGLLRARTDPGDESIDDYTIQNQYNEIGQLVYQKNNMGKVLIYTYNHDGQVLTQTGQKEDGSERITVSNAYDKNGNLRFITDANGATTEKVYDGLNREVQSKVTVSGSEQATTNTYDKNGNLLTAKDYLGNIYTNEYDTLDRLIQMTDPYGKVMEKYEYNDNHVQIRSYDALDNVTVYTYDKNNRLISTMDPSGHIISQTYDDTGNIAARKDGNDNVTAYGYDILNRLNKVTNAKGETTAYTYDWNGNMLTQKDGNGNTVTYSYNPANLPVSEEDPNTDEESGRTEHYTYYPDGTLKNKSDRNGSTFAYIYDIHGNLVKETTGDTVITYTYDNNKNMLSMTDGTGITTRTYDELSRTLSKTVPNVGIIFFEYDITEGEESGYSRESSIDPKGNVTDKVYDRAGRLSKVIAGTDVSIYTYYDNGNRESIVYSNGAREEYTYYANNQMETLINKRADGSIMDSYRYTYDNAGNQLTKDETINGIIKGITAYIYDPLNRLDSVTEPGGRTTTYDYDKAGNRLSEIITNGSMVTENSYTYNEQNRLTNIATKVNNVVTGVTEYTYDNNGNQLKSIVNTYAAGAVVSTVATADNTYDPFNQLIRTITEDGTAVNNEYNAEGYRTAKEVDGEKTYYLYEGNKVILELDKEGEQIARNVYGTNLLLRTAEGETYYYLYNGHADVTALITQNGTVASTYYYDAFGNILESTGNANNSILYSGYQYDKETGLYYLNARMYDPGTARFLQEDTYTGDPNDPLSLNLYTYCANEPVMRYDPDGHFWNIIIGGLIGAVVGTGFTAVGDFLDDGKFNSGWKAYAGAAAEGAITGAVVGATGGASLATQLTVGGVAAGAGNAANQYINTGKVDAGQAALAGATDIALGLGMAKAGKLLAATKIGQKVIQKADDAMTAISNKVSKGVAKAVDVEQAVKNKFKKSVSTSADIDLTDLNKVKNPFTNNIATDLPGTGSLDNLGLKTTGDMLDTGSSPYGLLKERGIPATLSEPEINAANAFDFRMQGGPEVNKGLGDKVYIPKDVDGNPVPLAKQRVNGQDIPLPDPAAEGRPHTVLGGKVSLKTGEIYRQSATFLEGTWPPANGQNVPWSEVHWTNHGRGDHLNPHQHIFEYNLDKGGWIRGGQSYFRNR